MAAYLSLATAFTFRLSDCSCQQLSVYPAAVIEHVSQLTKTTRHFGQEIFRKKKKNSTCGTCMNARKANSFLFAAVNSMVKKYTIIFFSYNTLGYAVLFEKSGILEKSSTFFQLVKF